MTVGRLAQLIATVERSYVRMACTGLSMVGVVSVPVELGGDLGQLDLSSINCDVLEATGSARGTRSSGTVAVLTCPAEATDACEVYEVLQSGSEEFGRRLQDHSYIHSCEQYDAGSKRAPHL